MSRDELPHGPCTCKELHNPVEGTPCNYPVRATMLRGASSHSQNTEEGVHDRTVTVANFSVFGNAKKIVRRMRRAFSGEDDLTPSAFSIFYLFLCFLFQVKVISLTPEIFTVENGLLTPTLKFKRPALKTHFQQTFEDLYRTVPE